MGGGRKRYCAATDPDDRPPILIYRPPTVNALTSGHAREDDPYEQDFYAWSEEQAALLRAGRAAEADLDNIVEEIESMGKSERRELISRLTVLLLHLLKWRLQRPKPAARHQRAKAGYP